MSTSPPPAAGHSMRQQLDELDALLQRMLALPINQLDDTAPAPEPAVPPRPAAQPAPSDATPYPAPQRPTPAAGQEGWRPPSMILLADSGPVQPPATPPEGWDPGWSINLNPQQGSSILGPRSPAAAVRPPAAEPPPPPTPAPPVWRAETVGFARPGPQPVGPKPLFQVATVPTPRPAAPAPAVHVDTAPAPVPPPAAVPAPQFVPRPVEPPVPLLLLPLAWLNSLFDAAVLVIGPPGRWLRSPVGRNLLGYSGLLMFLGGLAWGALDFFGWTW